MSIVEEMAAELDKLAARIHRNQQEYRQLLKEYAIKKRAYNAWAKPTIIAKTPKQPDDSPRYVDNEEPQLNPSNIS